MSIISKTSVKATFETGDRPTQAEFADFIDTAIRDSMVAIATAAEGGKTGIIEILGSTEVTALSAGAFGRQILSIAGTASARDALGITSVASAFLDSASTASSRSLLGASTIGDIIFTVGSTASAQNAIGLTPGTVGLAVFEAVATASAQDALGVRELTSDTVQDTSSGTNFVFSGIPSWVKRITVMFNQVSVDDTDHILIRIGDSGGVEDTGYNGSGTRFTTGAETIEFTTGFGIVSNAATDQISGSVVLTSLNSNVWVAHGVLGDSESAQTYIVGGSKSLSGTLDRVQILDAGADAFDNGQINIMYE